MTFQKSPKLNRGLNFGRGGSGTGTDCFRLGMSPGHQGQRKIVGRRSEAGKGRRKRLSHSHLLGTMDAIPCVMRSRGGLQRGAVI